MLKAGLNVHVAQPRVVHAFAVSLKLRAKTDTIDAAVCARYAHDRHHELRHAQPPQPTLRAIQALTTRRDQLVQMRTMESNRSQQADDKATLKSLRRSLTWMDNEIAKIEKAIDKLIHDDESLRAKSHALQQTKGVGPQTTRVLLACLPELGKESPKRLNALVGVAPYARDSGDRKATRHIAGGRPLVRSGLYMACMTAVSTNPVIAPYYRQLTSRGLAHKTAMIACIRKLLAHLDRILRTPPRPPAPIPTTANA